MSASSDAILEVLEPGLSTLVVDGGRPRTRGLGVAVGGAADRYSLALGNGLVGNDPDAAALEVTLRGPTLRADHALGCVVFGAPFDVFTDRRRLSEGTTFTLEPGEVLTIGGTPRGARAYLCVRGGLRTPVVLGSRTSLAPLGPGAALACRPSREKGDRHLFYGRYFSPPSENTPYEKGACPLFVVAGPQADWFDADLAGPWTVTPASNRMGLRLHGEPLTVPPRELVSEPVAPGAVQVTRDGQCIVLGVDGQTIGGYPKIAHVIAADLDRLGQLRPGDTVTFRRVTLDEAEARFRQRARELREWRTRLLLARSASE